MATEAATAVEEVLTANVPAAVVETVNGYLFHGLSTACRSDTSQRNGLQAYSSAPMQNGAVAARPNQK